MKAKITHLSLGESRRQALLDHLSQCIFLKDRKLRFIAANKAFCDSLGCTSAEVIGADDFTFYPPELAAKYQADDRRVLHEGKRLETDEQNMVGGKLRIVRVVKTPHRAADGSIDGILGIFWDVTEQRHLEAQARHAQKMQAILHLAGGVAHDFNNLLTGILGNLDLARAELQHMTASNPARVLEILNLAESAGRRAADLTNQLLSFARRAHGRSCCLDLNTWLKDYLPNVQSQLDSIQLVTCYEPDVWPVWADPRQLDRVFLNICLNAREAINHGGRLYIETANITLSAQDIGTTTDDLANSMGSEARPGHFVRLRIADTGTGISPDVLDHMFEPFFSTHEVGESGGLAMALAYGIVKEHGGWITCRSEVGKGTSFEIYLPRHIASAEVGSVPHSKGCCTIMLADSQEVVRRLGRDMLEELGYRVLPVHQLDAVETFRRHQAEIDLVLWGFTLSPLKDQECLDEIRKLKPGVRFVLSAGFPTGPALKAMSQIGASGFVAKPFRSAELAVAVCSALGFQT